MEKYFLSEQGFQHLGLILFNTKLDIDNPSLREWSILFVRNITSWSDKVRDNLNKLTMIDGNAPHDEESLKNLESLGQPMQEMYHKEREKYKRDEQDQKNI